MSLLNKLMAGAVFAGSVFTLSACGSTILGTGKNPPDEFSVLRKAPLSRPPEYNLRPPMENGAKGDILPQQQAKDALFGQ